MKRTNAIKSQLIWQRWQATVWVSSSRAKTAAIQREKGNNEAQKTTTNALVWCNCSCYYMLLPLLLPPLLHVCVFLAIIANSYAFFFLATKWERTTFAIITFHWYYIVASSRYASSNTKRANTGRQVGGHHASGAPQFACVATMHHSTLLTIIFFLFCFFELF